MRYFTYVVTVSFLILTMVGCDNLSRPAPKDVLSKYLDASLKGRYEEAYGYISSTDKAVKSMDDYLAENKEEDTSFAKALLSDVSFNILRVTETREKATAVVEVTLPDFGVIIVDVMGAAFKSAFGGGDAKEMKEYLAQKYQNGDLPLVTNEETFQLVKEQGGWKVFLDWETEKTQKEKHARIEGLLAEVRELKKSGKLHGVIEKYEQVLELDGELVEAKEGITETKKEIKSFEERQTYLRNVELYDLRAKYYKTYLGEVPGVEFKLKNEGNRTLKEVEVTVYFKDATGTIIAEEVYHPVLVTEYSLSGNGKPLKPNYIWQMERGHFYEAESVPTEWKEGDVSAKITDIEFTD